MQSPVSHDCCLWYVPLPHPSHGPQTLSHLARPENWNIHKVLLQILLHLKLEETQHAHDVHTKLHRNYSKIHICLDQIMHVL